MIPVKNRVPKGFSLVEVMIALTVFSLMMGACLKAWQVYQGKNSENLSKRLVLQMEARKALLTLYRELQEGIEVITPLPGTTLPYLAFKDYVNNIRIVYLEEDPELSKTEECKLYRAMLMTRDPSGATLEPAKVLMRNVLKLQFTAYSPGSVFLSTTLRGGRGEFSLVNFVRLQNVTAEDDL